MLSAASLEQTLRILLPEDYEVFDKEVQPKSMGSAGLKYSVDGRVLWDEMWASFCDLAMAGGPPHRGKLLQPEYEADADTEQEELREAASGEICRGIGLVTGLCAEPAPVHGWLRLYCTSAAMAGWLARATNMENVSAVAQGLSLFLPTGAAFRVEKEIKNVITSVAKGCHYWQDHMTEAKHDAIASLLAGMDREAPLLQVPLTVSSEVDDLREAIAGALQEKTGFRPAGHPYRSWVAIECDAVPAAVWVMRAFLAGNFVSRREGPAVFVPVNPAQDRTGERTTESAARVYQLASDAGVL